MTEYDFKYYLHDMRDTGEMIEDLCEQEIPEEVAEAIASERPFYEVEFDCVYDTDTGNLTVTMVH